MVLGLCLILVLPIIQYFDYIVIGFSTFSEGKFTQDISAVINTFADPEEEATTGEQAGAQEEAANENNEGTNDT